MKILLGFFDRMTLTNYRHEIKVKENTFTTKNQIDKRNQLVNFSNIFLVTLFSGFCIDNINNHQLLNDF